MTKPRLTYFDVSMSRGEECRMALFLAGVDFEDRRLKRGEWKELKPQTPFGALPMLEIEGNLPLAQSNAILGYIGRQHGLYPQEPWHAARHDAILAAVEELRHLMSNTAIGEEASLKARREAFVVGPLETWAKNMERQIKGPFIEGARLHVADIKVFTIVDAFRLGRFDHVPVDALAPFSRLSALHQAVGEYPKVVEWRARPAAG